MRLSTIAFLASVAMINASISDAAAPVAAGENKTSALRTVSRGSGKTSNTAENEVRSTRRLGKKDAANDSDDIVEKKKKHNKEEAETNVEEKPKNKTDSNKITPPTQEYPNRTGGSTTSDNINRASTCAGAKPSATLVKNEITLPPMETRCEYDDECESCCCHGGYFGAAVNPQTKMMELTRACMEVGKMTSAALTGCRGKRPIDLGDDGLKRE